MTHLLMLLLAVGQLGDTSGINYAKPKPNPTLGPRCETIITAEMLFEYADSCYADSTNERLHIDNHNSIYGACWGYPEGGGCREQSHYYYKWIHRTPTFPDFIAWLRRRTERSR